MESENLSLEDYFPLQPSGFEVTFGPLPGRRTQASSRRLDGVTQDLMLETVPLWR